MPVAGDDVLVSDRGVANGEFEHAIEQKPSATGRPPIEAEHELVEVVGQVRLIARTLVSTEQPPLRERGDAMYAGQQLPRVFPTSPSGTLITRLVNVVESTEPAVPLPAVRDDPTARLSWSVTKGWREAAEASTSGAILHRP